MRVLICGVDGYIGWSLAVYLCRQGGYEVFGIDNCSRRRWVKEVGSQSAIPILSYCDRVAALNKIDPEFIGYQTDLCDYQSTVNIYQETKPDAIVYLGEMPSAPYSMIDVDHAVYTQENNTLGTLKTIHAIQQACPDAHLVKLGTMGEYGTPPSNIPEGTFPKGSYWSVGDVHQGNLEGSLFPRSAGSWYHQSKVHDTHNVEMACRIWGLRSTDVMQGVVYGTQIAEMEDEPALRTRFDFDECFGTAINRFCAQAAIGMPLTPYGVGEQSRGFLHLQDSVRCLQLAIDNPPDKGEYRTFNQLEDVYTINSLAYAVEEAAVDVGLSSPGVVYTKNPRVENENHMYSPSSVNLINLGYQPLRNMKGSLRVMLRDLSKHKERIEEKREVLAPKTQWVPSPTEGQKSPDYVI